MTYQQMGVNAAERPKCWGKDFNSEDRECKGCSWQASCRDQVIRSAVNRQPTVQQVQAPMSYYQPFQQQQFVPQPQPMMQAPAPFQPPKPAPAPVQIQVQPPQPQYQVTQYRPPVPAAQVQVPQPITAQQAPAMFLELYGRYQDPLFYPLTTAPPPYRPQMTGETFFERVVKNTGLAILETVFMQGLLAARQMVLPPMPAQSNTVDVTPEKR